MLTPEQIEEQGGAFDLPDFFRKMTDDEYLAWHKEASRKLKEDPGLADELGLPAEEVERIHSTAVDFEEKLLAQRSSLRAAAEAEQELVEAAGEYMELFDKLQRPEVYGISEPNPKKREIGN